MNPRPSGTILFMTALLLAAAISMQGPVSAKSKSHTQTQTIWSHTDDSGRDFSFILVEEAGEALSGSGEMADYKEAERMGKQSGEDMVWARFDGHSYMILDKGVVAKVRKSMEPVRAVSEQQGKLGEEQGRLGEQQGRLGEQQARLGEREARISEKIARAQADGGSTKDLQKELDAVRDEAEDLSRQQSELARQQSALAKQQEPLSKQQQALGEQADKLSRKMNEDVEATVREAVKSGLAVKRS